MVKNITNNYFNNIDNINNEDIQDKPEVKVAG